MAISLSIPELLEQVSAQTLELASNTPIILIDGRSCSGKSTLAKQLQNQLFLEGESMPRIISMDDLYPGWDGLASGAEYLQRVILQPLLKGQTANWQEYDWENKQRNNWREFSGGTPLIIEGCGSITTFTASISDFAIWLEVPEDVRRLRWQERDGNRFDEYFELWSAQELDFMAIHKPKDLASHSYDYAATL